MPWKDQRVMNQKIEFVEKASQRGAKIAALCREYGISREAGYKWLKRFREHGYDGLNELSRRPLSAPLSTGEEIVVALLEAKEKYPTYGPDKIRTIVGRKFPDMPSRATVARILRRLGLISARKRRRAVSAVTSVPVIRATRSNEVWTIDFKGYWRTLDAGKCNPLTVRDAYSRFILCVQTLEQSSFALVKKEMTKLFLRYGVPKSIHCDNGTPFIAVRARGGISKLTAWWIGLGIQVIRSRPGCPQDNGGHERMHKDIAIQVEAHRAETVVAEQRALAKFQQEYNHVRPHDALNGKTPGEVYKPSPLTRLPRKVFIYPQNWISLSVTRKGMFRMNGDNYFLGEGLAGQICALEPKGGTLYHAWFGNYSLGDIEIWPDNNRLIELASTKPAPGKKQRPHLPDKHRKPSNPGQRTPIKQEAA